jgi:drug/metabolite transporter (DMT)-like permease
MASGYPTLSTWFVVYYGISILILMVYAVLWQLVLKRVELSRAYAMKPITTLLSMFWGVALFQEEITWNMLLGAMVILFGIRMAVGENE